MKKDYKVKESPEEMIYRIAKDFQERNGVNIFQAQLTELFTKERPDLDAKYMNQYVAIYVDALHARGAIEKTSKNSRTNIYVK